MSNAALMPACGSAAVVVTTPRCATLKLCDGRTALLDVPDDETGEFMRTVKADERARIREIFLTFREIVAARNIRAGCECAALKRAHLGWGWSAKALYKLFLVFRDGGHKPGDARKSGPMYLPGDWRVLVRDYKGKAIASLPEEFVRWLGERWTEFKGRRDCVRALWRHVVYEVWLKGNPVPGFGTVDEWCRRTGRARPHPMLVRQSELPDGWSERTFRRHLPKREAVRKQIAHGYLAAHQHQPDQVLTDRSELLPLQFIFLDDSRPDLRCVWFGPGRRGELVYPLIVLALDACSGVDVAHALKPRALKSEDGKSRMGVTQDMALAIVCATLRRFGLPPYKITFVHENAAACVPPEARRMLLDALGDRIDFMATGIFKERMAAHGFTDQGGAPYDKAPIEAFFRILGTQIARLPGSTGPRYDDTPGELAQIEKYTLGLLDKAGGLAEVFAKFRSPLLDFTQADEAVEAALRLLRFRTRHELQGFGRVREWRRSEAENYRPWHELLALPEAEQNAVGDIAERMEAPAERFVGRLAGVKLTPVSDDLLTWVEGPRQPVTIRDGKVTVKSLDHSDDRLIFREIDHPLLGAECEGRTFEGAISADGERLVLTHEGRVLGHVLRQDRINRADLPAIRREAGRVREARCADRAELRDYLLLDTDTALAELRAHNDAVAASLPALPEAPKPARKTLRAAEAALTQRATLNSQLADAVRDQEPESTIL